MTATRLCVRRALILAALVPPPTPAPAQGVGPPEVRTRLSATVDDDAGLVTGSAEIRYRHGDGRPVGSLALLVGHGTLHELRIDDAPAAADAVTLSYDTARIILGRELAAGDSVRVTLAWERETGPADGFRRGRRLALSDWYPRVLDEESGTSVREPVYGTVLLRLEVAEDQVLGGTGVPLCGDPGWRGAAAFATTRVTLQRNWYAAPRDPSAARADCGGAPPGRKVVTWYAEDVLEAAYVLSPTFRFEEGDFLERPVHALYERGEERIWGAGLATRRTEAGMAWVLELGGRYPWPQLTVAHGLGASDQALPMMILAASPSQTAILDLLGLLATQQILSGGARVFTVGSAAYQTAWFFEALGRRGEYARLEREILDWDLDGVALGDETLAGSSGPTPCRTTSCLRTEFMSYQLRHWAGSDEAMRRLYLTLYSRFRLRPTVPGAFQRIAAELIQPPPDSLYTQLPRGGTLYDDAIVAARRERIADSGWRTTVVVRRNERGRFPQTLWVIADSDTVATRAAALTPSETLSVVTRTRPRRTVLDPLARSHDWNMLNNQRVFGPRTSWLVLAPQRHLDTYLDTYFTRHTARDRLTVGLAPTAWYNDVAGWTFGTRMREDYLGRFELNEAWLSLGTGWGAEGGRTAVNGRLTLRNPVALRATGWAQQLALAWEEGRAAAAIGLTRRFRTRLDERTARSVGVALAWLGVTDPAFLDPQSWDDAGTVELAATGAIADSRGTWPARLVASVAGGYAYPNAAGAPRATGYGRLQVEASVRGAVSSRLSVGVRAFVGALAAPRSSPRQRRFGVAGADAYQRFASPFLRSRGALFAGDHFPYHAPGGAGLRGFDPRLTAPDALGATLEVEYALSRRPAGGLLHRVAVAGFVDAALANGDLARTRDRLASAADAGIGLRLDHRLGRTPFQTRLDLPLWVSRPELAQDDGPAAAGGFRWTFSFVPAF